jgi:hypothetical protein
LKTYVLTPKIKPSNEEDSNRLLRAFWATIRAEFGNLHWQYAPSRYGSDKKIYFGFANFGEHKSIRIGITYKKRGVIDSIILEDLWNKNDMSIEKLKICLRKAEVMNETKTFMGAEIFIPYELLFQSENSYPVYSIESSTQNKTKLILMTKAFDEFDAREQFFLFARPILDILSASTNLFFDISQPEKCTINIASNEQVLARPPHQWIDDYPLVAKMIVLPEYSLNFLAEIINSNLDERKKLIIAASHHFHLARYIEERTYDQSHQSTLFAEQSLVLYLSSLEVISLLDSESPTSCKTCGQTRYRIASRVESFTEKYNGSHAAKLIKRLYAERSKYLHMGRLLSSRSYSGSTLPQLDSSTYNGVRSPRSIEPLYHLRELISFSIRSIMNNLIDH